MNWTKSNGAHTATAEGLNFVLEPTDWSIWDLAQAKESARHIAARKASGETGWANGFTVRLFFRETGKR